MAGWRFAFGAAVLCLCVCVAIAAPGPQSNGHPAAAVPGQPSREAAVAELGADEDLTRKKNKVKKGNSTIGEEVLSAIIDGITGESEDAAFGSDIRKEFGYLISAVSKFGQAAASEYASSEGQGQSRKCEGSGCAESGRADTTAVEYAGEGRRRQVKRLLVRYIVLLKVFAVGIILPGAVLLALLQSWKAVTVSLMALLLAGVIGLRGLVTSAAKPQAAEVIHTAGPSHYWRRTAQEPQPDADRLAYGGYAGFAPIT